MKISEYINSDFAFIEQCLKGGALLSNEIHKDIAVFVSTTGDGEYCIGTGLVSSRKADEPLLAVYKADTVHTDFSGDAVQAYFAYIAIERLEQAV